MSINANRYQATTTRLQRTQETMKTARAGITTTANARAAKAQESSADASIFMRQAGRSAWDSLRSAGHGTKSAAVSSAMTGAAAGFAVAGAVGWIGHGFAHAGQTAMSGLSRGFLAVSNALARSVGEKTAQSAPAQVPKAPTFADRMWAKMHARMADAKAGFSASGSQFATAGRTTVQQTAPHLKQAIANAATATGRYAVAGGYEAARAANYAAQMTIAATQATVHGAERAVKAISRGALNAACVTARPAGRVIIHPVTA